MIDKILKKICTSKLLTSDEWHILTEWLYEDEKRIDKAIKYIEEHNQPITNEMEYYSSSELLDILKGEDKE